MNGDKSMTKLQFEGKEIAQAVIDRMKDCKDPRFQQVMASLIKHAHAFVQDVDLKPDE
jgi:hydroxyquinol 1,2-dioxygenase